MTLRLERGDLFDSELPALAHGCNTVGAMGSGIAREFRRRWPAMYDDYRARCLAGTFKLGDVLPWWEDPTQPLVFNLATQPRPGRTASLGAIRAAVKEMLGIAELFAHVEAVGMPQIGCGLGGLEWMDVHLVLEDLSEGHPVELVVYELVPRSFR
jgi:O-acetyl-ADP-ribose deacetylase (regulator of RNase III)